MDNESDRNHCEQSTSAYRNVEYLVADITDRALLNAQLQKKQAFESSIFEANRLRDHFNYSFCNHPTNNFEIGYSFKKLGIGTSENADNIINYDESSRSHNGDDTVLTPNMSSTFKSESSDEEDEKDIEEKMKDNPFYGMKRVSHDSNNSKQNNNYHQTDYNDNPETMTLPLNNSKNYLNIFYFIIKFKCLLKKFISSRNIFTLKSYHFELLNDKSFGDQMVKKGKQASTQDKIIHSLKFLWEKYTRIPVLDPSHFIVVIQEIVSFAYILSLFFVIPIKTCFPVTINNYYLQLGFEILPPYYLFFEMLFKINAGFYSEGIAILDRISAFQNYLKNDFIVDVITTVVLYVNQTNSQYNLIFLFRIPQMQQLFGKILLVAHICGCGFHYVGLHTDPDNNWIVKNKLNEATIIENYVTSIYFAIIAMVTVGFGDIVPINMYEKIYVILQTCFSCGIFAFAINTIGGIVKDKQTQTQELKINKNSVLSYMKDRNISAQNQNKVIRYLEYSHKNQNDLPQKGKEIIQNMGKSVRDDVYDEFFQRVINQMPLFRGNFTEKFKLELQSQLQETAFGPGDCIITEGRLSKKVFFIITGEVHQFAKMEESSQKQQTLLQILKQGDTFDQESFLSNQPSQYEYISKTVTQVVFIEKEIFDEIIQTYKFDYEQYCLLIHRIKFEEEFSLQSTGCTSCKDRFHNALKCPLLHYDVNRELLLKRFICDKPQKREFFHRMRKRTNRGSYKAMHSELRLLRLRLPKTYNSSNSQRQDIFSSEQNDFARLLEYDDEALMMCSPQIQYSYSQDDIIFLLGEEDIEIQEIVEEGGDNNTEYTQEHTSVHQSDKNKVISRRNGFLFYKTQNDDNFQEILEEKLDESIGAESKNDQLQQQDQQHQSLKMSLSQEFILHQQKTDTIKGESKQPSQSLPRASNPVIKCAPRFSGTQIKSKSLTNIQHEIHEFPNLQHKKQMQISIYDEIQEKNTSTEKEDKQKNVTELEQKNQQQVQQQTQQQEPNSFDLIEQQKIEENTQNLKVEQIDEIESSSDSNQKQYQLQQQNYNNNNSNVNNNNNNNPNNNNNINNQSFLQNLDESSISIAGKVDQPNLNNFCLTDEPHVSNLQIQLQMLSDRNIPPYPIKGNYSPQSPINAATSPHQQEIDSFKAAFNKYSDGDKSPQKQGLQQRKYGQSQQREQKTQQNSSNIITSNQQIPKQQAPILQVLSASSASKQNYHSYGNSAQNIAINQQSSTSLVQQLQQGNPRNQKRSILLNEPSTHLPNQPYSYNSISNIKELSTYSRRTMNSAYSQNRIVSQLQPSFNSQQVAHAFNSQLSQTHLNQQQQQQQLNSPKNQHVIAGVSGTNLARQSSTFSISTPNKIKKQQTFFNNKFKSNSTLVRSQIEGFQTPLQQPALQPISNDPQDQEYASLDSDFMIFDFDIMKIFQYFLPHNNVDRIIEELKLKVQTKITMQRRTGGKHNRKQKRIRGTIMIKRGQTKKKVKNDELSKKQGRTKVNPTQAAIGQI